MEFQEFFDQTKQQFIHKDISSIPDRLAIEINLTGEAQGTFYIEVKDNQLSIEPFSYNDRDVALTISSQDFQKLIAGKLDPILAFTMGKLKVDGDIGMALELKKFI